MVDTNTFVRDTIILIRDLLSSNVTDPISSSRSGRERFVMTSYPQRVVKYPIVTIRNLGVTSERMGARSSLYFTTLSVEVRVWARNEKEKDELSQDAINVLRSNELSASGTYNNDLHDFMLVSSVPVDELGEQGVKSQVMTFNYIFILGE